MGFKQLKEKVGLNSMSTEKKAAALLLNKSTGKGLKECGNIIKTLAKKVK